MARLVGVDLPRDKRLEIALTYIFGIGRTRATETLTNTGVSPDLRVKDVSDDDLLKLREWIEANYKIEGDLRRETAADIRRKVEIGVLSGHPSPPGPAGPRPTNPHECAYPQGPAQGCGRQEEARQEVAPVVLRTPIGSDDLSFRSKQQMPPKTRQQGAGAKKVRRKEKKNVAHGHAHIKSTFNNTIVSITDPTGAVIAWASAATSASRVRASRPPSPPRWPLNQPAAGRRSMACARSTSS